MDFVEGNWFELSPDALGTAADDFLETLMDTVEIGPELEELGCDASEDFLQAVYYNENSWEDSELVWEVECMGVISFVRTLGFPPYSSEVMESEEVIPGNEKKTSAAIDPNTFVDGTWYELSLEGLASDTGMALEKVMEMPKLAPLLTAKGCNPYENFIQGVFLNADNLQEDELLFVVFCQGDISAILTLGLPPYSAREIYVASVL
ncbi:uncharacterized protein LOC142336536 [Convolutriloba macropyga]|uniref:uncharacterized protein LOC142336536 n=1 Tax=Convolutriloba macropyga TaxID=536237 RepID=UPI003F528336